MNSGGDCDDGDGAPLASAAAPPRAGDADVAGDEFTQLERECMLCAPPLRAPATARALDDVRLKFRIYANSWYLVPNTDLHIPHQLRVRLSACLN